MTVNQVSPDVINIVLAVVAILVPVTLAVIAFVGRGMSRRADQITANIQELKDEIKVQGLRLNAATTKVDTLKGALDMHSRSHNGAAA
jgi:hypothetical protein